MADNRVDITDDLHVFLIVDEIHVSLAIRCSKGEFLSQSLLLSPEQARRLAAGLIQLADEHDALTTAVPAAS